MAFAKFLPHQPNPINAALTMTYSLKYLRLKAFQC